PFTGPRDGGTFYYLQVPKSETEFSTKGFHLTAFNGSNFQSGEPGSIDSLFVRLYRETQLCTLSHPNAAAYHRRLPVCERLR
ncbi:MAG: hypothetical protein AAFS12_10010, partial [Cyanobacteria bacterium J06632_19]